MYTSFKIENFRGFDHLELNDLARINLIAGKNNMGKTTVLESLFIHCGGYQTRLVISVQLIRGIDLDQFASTQINSSSPWDSIFYCFDNSKIIRLDGINSETGKLKIELEVVRQPEKLTEIFRRGNQNGGALETSLLPETTKVLELRFDEDNGNGKRKGSYQILFNNQGLQSQAVPSPAIEAAFLSARSSTSLVQDAERFGQLERTKRQNIVLNTLKIIEPRLTDLTVIPLGGIPTLHGDIGLGELVALPIMGEGIRRLASIILAIGNSQNGVTLIDEIENGLHYSVLEDVWKAIAKAARDFNVQIFATTHSLEMIRAAHQAFIKSETYDFRYHRLDRRKSGDITASSYDQETMQAAIEMDFEIRG